MPIKIKVTGLRNLSKALSAAPAQTRKRLDAAIAKNATELAGSAKALAPEKSGALKASITAEQVGDGWVVEAADEAAPHVEFGTRMMPAQPFFYPAYRALKVRFKRRNQRAINSALKDVGLR